MVPECWCVVSRQVEVGLESVTPVGIEVLCLLNLVGTLLVGNTSVLLFFFCDVLFYRSCQPKGVDFSRLKAKFHKGCEFS